MVDARAAVGLGASARAARGVSARRLWLLAFVLALALAVFDPARATASGRYAAMVVDANTGQVLHADAADEPRFPASLTKMMTLYLVFEQLDSGRLTPATRIRMSAEAASAPPSRLGLEAGETISVADAIKVLITKSANDVSTAIAEHIGGDEARFAAMMTRKARELGMTATTFRNPHGLPDSAQITTARDMITLTLRLYDNFPEHTRAFATRTFRYAGRNFRNHNTLLGRFEGMEGIKTGYTSASGFNLVSSVRRDGRHVVAAVFGGNSAAARNARMRVLLTRSLPQASTRRTRRPVLVAASPALRAAPSAAVRHRPSPVAGVAPAVPFPAETRAPAPRLAEPLRAVASGAAPAPVDNWRTRVRLAGAQASGTSVAAHIGRDARREAVDFPPPRPPSTLQAQAASLGAGIPSFAGPRAIVSAPADGNVQIQIGAFAQMAEAREQLAAARQHAPELLASASLATPSVAVKGRTLYRARFTGLDAATAASACATLRRRQIDCLVTTSN